MTWGNTSQAYGSVAKFLHWLIFLLVVCLLTVGFSFSLITDPSLARLAYSLHKSFGLLLLFLMIIRVIWALLNPKPTLPQHMSLSVIPGEMLNNSRTVRFEARSHKKH